ncbi:MAG: PHP domain-containing protein [Candidatus Omnitrophica bacterium]|nr:PHP domain-containing protein [Candidatus Omnitrophota bacterium]MDD5488660.1 PHP domain-containing protein [Candidatus Omnitrophota bacterium]
MVKTKSSSEAARDKAVGRVDLHVHTNYSDGVLSPEDVVKNALNKGLSAVAITDHDCVDGIDECMEAARGTGLEIVPGVEISASSGDNEIHILGYFVAWKNAAFRKAVKKIQENRLVRMGKMLDLLREKGVNISTDSVMGEIKRGSAGRLHIARALVSEKMVENIRDAFDKYIGKNGPCYVRYERFTYEEAIALISSSGGIPVLAHPGAYGRDDDIRSYVDAGLKGLEVYHPKHSYSQTKKYKKLAEKYGLIVTGGSDCHGTGGDRIMLGSILVEHDVVSALRSAAEARQEKQ